MSLRSNAMKNSKFKLYNWRILKHDTEIRNVFIVKVKTDFRAFSIMIEKLRYPPVQYINILKKHAKMQPIK